MILPHGGLGSGEMFGPDATSSSSTCRVTAAPPTSTDRGVRLGVRKGAHLRR